MGVSKSGWRAWVLASSFAMANLVALAGAGGCNLDSAGLNAGSPRLPQGEGSSSGGSDSVLSTGPTTSTTGGNSTTAPNDPGSDSSPTDTGSGPAMLELTPMLDFGPVEMYASAQQSITVTNVGDQSATGIEISELNAPFSVTASDCGATLEPEAACVVSVGFSSAVLGPFAASLQVEYDDGSARVQDSSEVLARSTGQLDALLVNPGAEADLTGWTTFMGSADWGTHADPVRSGRASFVHGESFIGTIYRLEQSVDISPHANAVDSGELAASVEGFMVGEGSELLVDEGAIIVEYRSGGTVLDSHVLIDGSPADWTAGELQGGVPPQTRQVVVRLECAAAINGLDVQTDRCNVSFDDLGLKLRYD